MLINLLRSLFCRTYRTHTLSFLTVALPSSRFLLYHARRPRDDEPYRQVIMHHERANPASSSLPSFPNRSIRHTFHSFYASGYIFSFLPFQSISSPFYLYFVSLCYIDHINYHHTLSPTIFFYITLRMGDCPQDCTALCTSLDEYQ